MSRTTLYAGVIFAALSAASAHGQITWTGAANDGGNWNNAANWSPASIPNSTSADALFGDIGVGNVSVQSNISARSLTFSNAAGNYNLNSSSAVINNSLFITVGPAVTGVETINLGNIATGSLLFLDSSGGGNLTITNNSTVTTPTLVIGPNTVIGTPGIGGVTVAGTGATVFSGSFASGSHAIAGTFLKTGSGTLTFRGSGTNLQGGLTLSGGAFALDYSTGTATKLSSGVVTLNGGVLSFVPNAGTGVTQAFPNGTVFAAGHTDIQGPSSGTSNTLNLGSISRAAGATADLSIPFGSTFVLPTSAPVTNGLLGNGPAFATVEGGFSWATVSGGNVAFLSIFSTNFQPNANTSITNNQAPAPFTTNSLDFGINPSTLALTGANTIQSGGILVEPQIFSGTCTIAGGSLSSGVGELIVHSYSSLTINSDINATLTKTGDGSLFLGGLGPTGTININRGFFGVTSPSALARATAINFNDNRSAVQGFSVDLGDGVAATVSLPIQFAAYGNASSGAFNNFLSNGATSRITLAGVIGSVPGTITPIYLFSQSSNISGFNLTAVNTFTGDVKVGSGTLGINSNASLGNAANTLYLDTQQPTGGLEFLTTGVNLPRAVVIVSPSRIASNGGDVNTVSGPISGPATLYKDGTGTLVLSGVNTQSGLAIIAGTVRVAADVNLGAAGATIAISSGATLALTGSLTNSRAFSVGPLTGNVPGNATIDVAAGQLVTLNGQIGGTLGGLIKTGAGTLALGFTSNSYGGGTTVQTGTLVATSDGSLGLAGSPLTLGAAGTLIFAGSTSTSRMFTLNSGTLAVPAGGTTLTLNGASVFGGFLHGAGTFAVTGGTAIRGSATASSTTVSVTGAGSFTDFSNSGSLSMAAGPSLPTTLNNVINQGSGSMTVGATSKVNLVDFQTYGTLTISPATLTQDFSQTTLLTNSGTSQLFFNGGSRTFVGTPATAVFPSDWPNVAQRGTPTFVAGIDLNVKNAIVAGGLFVNNGYVEDSSNGFAGTATIVADFGALVKGAGFFQNSVVTQNGGKFQAGNSPGVSSFGKFVLGAGGVSSYVFTIDDATGAAGPVPDGAGHVSGWGLVKAIARLTGATTTPGDFTWTATPADKLLVSLQTLVNPTTVGVDVPGTMDHFDPTLSYMWPAVEWSGSYAGPADDVTLNASTAFDTSGFVNAVAGRFGWSLDTDSHTLSLTYTPSAVPEPGTLALTALTACGWAVRRRRRH
jgi:autotransporter-associated beta strand protein